MLQDVFNIFDKWLYIEDREAIEIILATAVASQIPGDPLWLFILGPSGSTKTEIARSFKGSPRVYTTDTITPKALISGWREPKRKQAIDVLPQLNGKLLIIKDFTAMLSRPDIETTQVFGTLRGAYDGYFESVYGSGVGKKSFEATFGLIACVTPIIDIYSKVNSLLGERFLRLRDKYNRHKATYSAVKHAGHETQMRTEIGEVMRIALDFYSLKAQDTNFMPTEDILVQIVNLADIVTILRSTVARDRKHEVKYFPEAEVGTRVSKQLLRLAEGLKIMGVFDYSKVLRVAKDSIPTEKLRLVIALSIKGELSTAQASDTTRVSRSMIRDAGEDLWLLGAVDRRLDDNTYYYKLKDDFDQSLKAAKIVG